MTNAELAKKIEEQGAQIAALMSQNETLASNVEELKKATPSGEGDPNHPAIEERLQKIDAKVATLAKSVQATGDSVAVSTEKPKAPEVPKGIITVNKKKYRFKVAKLSLNGKSVTAQQLVDGSKEELANVVKTYPGLFEAVK